MNFNQLRVFDIVAESQNFSHAADKLNISQPAVSTQIRKLEETLGIPLVESYGRYIKLTEAGRILKDYTARIFLLSQEANRAMEEFRGMERGLLLLGASTTPGIYLLPPFVGLYRKQFPGVKLALKISNTRTIQEELANGMLDVGVTGEIPDPHPDLIIEPWRTDRLVLVMHPDHPLSAKEEVSLQDLSDQPFIFREKGSSTRQIVEECLLKADVRVSPALELDNTEAVKHAVSSGLGISILSENTVRWEADSGRLKIAAFRDGGGLQRTLCVVSHVARRQSRVVSAFLQMII